MARKTGIIVFLMAAFGAPVAMADILTTYTINFAGTGTLPTAGSFIYDQTSPQFSSFLVTWDAFTFDLTSPANTPQVLNGSLSSCIDGIAGAEASFDLLSGDCQPPPSAHTTSWDAGILGGSPGSPVFRFVDQNNNPPFDGLRVETTLPMTTGTASGGGTWTITPVAAPVPEPSSAILMTTLFAVAFVARKRIGQGLRQATRTNR
jgi:hypothetical protein